MTITPTRTSSRDDFNHHQSISVSRKIASIVDVITPIETLIFALIEPPNYKMRNALFEWTITAAAIVSLAMATTAPFRPPGWLSSSSASRLGVDIRGGSTSPKKKKNDPVAAAEEGEPVTVDAELLYLPGLLDTVITRTRKVRRVTRCASLEAGAVFVMRRSQTNKKTRIIRRQPPRQTTRLPLVPRRLRNSK